MMCCYEDDNPFMENLCVTIDTPTITYNLERMGFIKCASNSSDIGSEYCFIRTTNLSPDVDNVEDVSVSTGSQEVEDAIALKWTQKIGVNGEPHTLHDGYIEDLHQWMYVMELLSSNVMDRTPMQ